MKLRKILVCVLDWGLGHATRSLALVHKLESLGFETVIASSGQALALLNIELPGRKFYDLPSYGVNYRSANFVMGIIWQLPRISQTISAENKLMERIVEAEEPIAIISDCRYGCYHKRVRSIFLSHQLQIQLIGAWQKFVNAFHHRMIRRFDEVWVPDYPDRSLSGDLSRTQIPVTFIGPLTTMKKSTSGFDRKYDVLAVLSGPEPQRTLFAEQLRNQFEQIPARWLIVHGLPQQKKFIDEHNVAFMTRTELNEAMQSAGLIVARSGYSTLMDIAALEAHALFVPTPGQTEQLYLADQLTSKGIAMCLQQANMNLPEAMKASKSFAGFPHSNGQGSIFLDAAVRTFN